MYIKSYRTDIKYLYAFILFRLSTEAYTLPLPGWLIAATVVSWLAFLLGLSLCDAGQSVLGWAYHTIDNGGQAPTHIRAKPRHCEYYYALVDLRCLV